MLKHIVAAASAVFLAACASSGTDLDQAGHLMAELKTATGGPAVDAPKGFHETGAIQRNGQAGTYETWGDLHHLRSVSTMSMGGMTFTRGFDGSVAWAVGPDGSVQEDTSPEGIKSAKLGAYLSNSGYLYPDRIPATYNYIGQKESDGHLYDVVTVTPEGIEPIDLWLDRETHLLKRISGKDGDDPYTGLVEQYETIDGVSIVFALMQRVGDQTISLKLHSHRFETVDPARFSPPEE